MESIPISKIVERLVNEKFAEPNEIKGCSEEEIETLEKKVNLYLPKAYKEFLTIMGHGAGRFLHGEDVFYNDILEHRESAEDILKINNNPFKLPSDAFVFYMHHGIIFYFFRIEQYYEEDPYVYGYLDGDLFLKCFHKRFSDFLWSSIDDSINIRAKK